MVADDVLLACRLSGLGVDELWLRFLELGGTRSKPHLLERLAGAAWPVPDDRVLAVVAAEALREAGLPAVATTSPPVLACPVVPVAGPGATLLHDRFSALYTRCAGTRAEARTVRARAVAARSVASGRGLLPGGC